MIDSSSADFFEAKYRAKSDPWNFSSSPYEQQRYQYILDLLDERQYSYGFEPGCSIGILTEKLARHCKVLEAIDFSETAVNLAKRRCERLPNVTLMKASVKDHYPLKQPDLIVLSEMGYYFSPDEWNTLIKGLLSCCARSATVIACHWLGKSDDHVMSGDDVHIILEQQNQLKLITRLRFDEFRLDRWVLQ